MSTQQSAPVTGSEGQARRGERTTVRYMFSAFWFGLLFPFTATVIDILVRGLPMHVSSVLVVQTQQPLHWIIDSAPLALALAGWIAGARQESVEEFSAGLETRVSERTSELALNTARLQTIAEVGSFVTQARDLNQLLREVVDLIVERFDFYHAQVFLIDEDRRYAVLQASTGEAGRALLARRHRLEVGSRSVIGQVASKGEPVIALDTDTDVVHQRNELLPNTRSEMALPLMIGDRIVGALDVQSLNANAFSRDDVPVFQTMADQLAVAIDNVRLFEEAQTNLQEVEALNRQLTGQAWVDYLAERGAEKPLGYQASGHGVRLVDGVPQRGESASDGVTSLPLTVRGKTIGSLDVEAEEDKELDEDLQAVLEAVAERVALALDNTRLAEHAQRTAQIQQLINMFSEQLQRTTDLRAILRLTATEASNMLGAPRGFVQLETRATDGNGQE